MNNASPNSNIVYADQIGIDFKLHDAIEKLEGPKYFIK
jgi:hypothetical protein